jgi:hypothetical protein
VLDSEIGLGRRLDAEAAAIRDVPAVNDAVADLATWLRVGEREAASHRRRTHHKRAHRRFAEATFGLSTIHLRKVPRRLQIRRVQHARKRRRRLWRTSRSRSICFRRLLLLLLLKFLLLFALLLFTLLLFTLLLLTLLLLTLLLLTLLLLTLLLLALLLFTLLLKEELLLLLLLFEFKLLLILRRNTHLIEHCVGNILSGDFERCLLALRLCLRLRRSLLLLLLLRSWRRMRGWRVLIANIRHSHHCIGTVLTRLRLFVNRRLLRSKLLRGARRGGRLGRSRIGATQINHALPQQQWYK